MQMEIIYCFLALLSNIFSLYKILKLFQPKKNLPPSPPKLPLFGHIHLLKAPFHRTFHSLSLRYGPVFSLWLGFRPILVVSSPEAAEECFTQNDIVFANRPNSLVGQLAYNYSLVTWASYGDHWRNIRRVITMLALSGKRIEEVGPIRRNEIQCMIKEILKSSKDGSRKVNLSSLFEQLTRNIVMRIVNGKTWRSTFNPASPIAINVCDFVPVLRWIGYKGLDKKVAYLNTERDEYFQDVINECRENRRNNSSAYIASTIHETVGEEKKKTLIEELLDLQENDPHYYTDDILKGIISVMLVAGSHTSSRTLECAFSLLLNYPKVVKKAKLEIQNEVGTNRLVNDLDLPKLPYIRCILNETLRLFPPAPLLLPHYSSKDCKIGGYHVPKGTVLFVNAWAIHRDPKLWDDPTQFAPERFKKEREGFKFMPFGIGKRSCPGNNLALKNVSLALATLLQCFNCEIAEPASPDFTQHSSSFVPSDKPLEAICFPHSSMIDVLSQI